MGRNSSTHRGVTSGATRAAEELRGRPAERNHNMLVSESFVNAILEQAADR